MKMDEVLYNIAEKVKNFAVIYLVDITKVPDFNKMYVKFLIYIIKYIILVHRLSEHYNKIVERL